MVTVEELLNLQNIQLTEEIKIIDGLNEFILTRGKLEGPSFNCYLHFPVNSCFKRGEYCIESSKMAPEKCD